MTRIALAALLLAGCRAPAPPPAASPPATVEVAAPPPAPASDALPPASAEPEHAAPKLLDLPHRADFEGEAPILVVTITKQGQLLMADRLVADLAALEAQAGKAAAAGTERVAVRADGQVPWGQVVEVVDALRRGGIERIAFVVETGSGPAPPLPPPP